jgi:tryptophanyl-tRNA synthetase
MGKSDIVLTGIKPTGAPHLGNYLGAIRPALLYLKRDDLSHFFFIADYHAYTSVKDPKKFQEYIYEIAATWLACGLDPNRVIFYRQKDVPQVFELAWLLACHTPKGDMNRAHAYKAMVSENEDKGNKDPDYGVNMGLFTYPILMAADILLFNSTLVPVGKDQVQHVEIARSMAKRINQFLKKEVFESPKEMVQDDVATVQGLDGRKMSKSYNNTIPLFTTEKKLKKLVGRIKTDSTAEGGPKQIEGSLIFDYFKLFGSKEETLEFKEELEKGLSWGLAKEMLFNVINKELSPLREKYDLLMGDKKEIDEILLAGGKKAHQIAEKNMQIFREALLGCR